MAVADGAGQAGVSGRRLLDVPVVTAVDLVSFRSPQALPRTPGSRACTSWRSRACICPADCGMEAELEVVAHRGRSGARTGRLNVAAAPDEPALPRTPVGFTVMSTLAAPLSCASDGSAALPSRFSDTPRRMPRGRTVPASADPPSQPPRHGR